MKLNQEAIEKNVGWLIVLVVLLVSVGGLVEIVPLYLPEIDDRAGRRASSPTRRCSSTGRDIYLREGCYNCHSQMIRPFRAETERYGHYSVAGEFVYDHPFQWGSKRTGPGPARASAAAIRDDWHRVHLNNPRDVVPESNMPGYPWLAKSAGGRRRHRRRRCGAAPRRRAVHATTRSPRRRDELKGKTEQDALIAYLQDLGTRAAGTRGERWTSTA